VIGNGVFIRSSWGFGENRTWDKLADHVGF